MDQLRMTNIATGEAQLFPLAKDEIAIGKAPDNDIVVVHASVSRRHCKFMRRNSGWEVQDLKSTNGTFVNGVLIDRPALLAKGAQIAIGQFLFSLDADEDRPSAAVSAPRSVEQVAVPAEREPEREPPQQRAEDDRVIQLRKEIHKRLLEVMDVKRMDISKMKGEDLRQSASQAVKGIVSDLAGQLPSGVEEDALVKDIVDEALGLGPLEDLLADPTVTEIMVNNKDQIYVERKGKLQTAGKRFTSNEAVMAVIERIVAPLGRRIDESSPMVDARLADGSRVNAIIPPLALKGPSITIRKFSKGRLTTDDLVRYGSMTQEMAKFLKICVVQRKNVVISGGTGSGKTTLLNILSDFIPSDERIVTVEDAAELRLSQDHVVSLESRPPNIEGKGAVTIRDLVRNCLRMRPDRIVVGECRGGEALDMLQAMNTGHDGSLTTLHANAPRDALARLETMVLMSGMDLPIRAIREQIGAAIDLIVQQSRILDGSRKVTHITEVTGMEGEIITLQDIFVFKQTGMDSTGKVQGKHEATGVIPSFYDELRKRGLAVDMNIFQLAEGADR